ncbi:trypsin-like peptidase domain-containing protein [soil metagenome]
MDPPDSRTPEVHGHDVDPNEPQWPSTDWPAGPIGPPAPIDAGEGGGRGELPPRRDRWTTVLTLMGGVLLGTGVTLGVLGVLGVLDGGPLGSSDTTVVATTRPPIVPEATTASVTDVAAAAVPSIVAVEVLGAMGIGGGSGVVYDTGGHILTNHHVVDGSEQLFVVFSDGARYPAEIVGSDALTDIAVLSTARVDATPIRLGTQADLVIGERTVAVGNPLGLRGGPSVTSGILSATGRTLQVEANSILYGLLQTDAPITRGSSGGALLDQEAKLIGITTAIGVSDVGAEGLGFAVPVDLAMSVADDLIADGSVSHALLGIAPAIVTDVIGDAEIPLGVGVEGFTDPDSAYADSGGMVDDVILSLEGTPVTTPDGLIALLRMRRAGDEVSVRVLRDSDELTFGVTLGAWRE